MSITTPIQCVHMSPNRVRCKHITAQSDKCDEHLLDDDGLFIKESTIPGIGLGLFTSRVRFKGDLIVPYAGTIIMLNESDDTFDTFGGAYVLQLTEKTFVDAARTCSGAGRYSNTCRPINVRGGHSIGNNAQLVSHPETGDAWIEATRFMAINEEIFTDYGETYFSDDEELCVDDNDAEKDEN